MAYLSRIFIYPVKALDGVAVQSSRVLSTGALADDRRFAIFDSLGQFVNGKRNPRVHLLRSKFDPNRQTLELSSVESRPRTFHVESDRRPLEDWLSEFFGFAVTFRENTDAGFPDDTDSPGPTLISTATLRAVSDWFGLPLDQVRARFRTNLEIDGVPPFWEDQLYGLRGVRVRFKIGQVVLDGINPCQRCVVPTRDTTTGAPIPDFAKRFVELRKKYLPDWAESSRFNHYYRLAINTRLVSQEPALCFREGDNLIILGPVGAPTPVAAAPAQNARWTGQLRVAEIIQITPSVRTFRLASPDGGKLPFTYLPGQYLNIEVPVDGTIQKRCYTIASTPTRPDYCELTIKREETGTVSRYFHDHLRQGMELNASGPGGKFTFTGQEAESIALFAGGVGITPLMSVIRYLTDRKWPGSIDLIYSAKNECEIIFHNELDSLAAAFPNLRITTTLTRATNGWPGRRGRIDSDLIHQILPDLKNRRLHICGPSEMAHELRSLLEQAGASPEQIKIEAFGGSLPGPGVSHNGNGRAIGTVTFADSGKSTPIFDGQTVLEAAATLGVPIDRGCLAGICGRCKVRLIAGDVEMDEDESLAPCEKKEGFVLACQARPHASVAVEA